MTVFSKIAVSCLSFVFSAVVLARPVFAQEQRPIRVLSFNIHHCEGVDGKTDIARIAEIIRAADPDLVALQEVDVRTARTGNVDQAAELARLCEMHYRFGKTIDYQGGQYGNAVLSKGEILATENIPLPPHGGEPRALLSVRARIADHPPLQFIATHFDNSKHPARLASAAQLTQIVQAQTIPTVVAGDLNCTPDSEPISKLLRALQLPDPAEHLTSPVGKPTRQIDYILFDRHSEWEFVETRVLDPAGASDHRPLLSVVRLK